MDFLIESQIKVYPTVGDFPATGAVKTLYIDESTSTTYYWTGSAYSEIRTEAKYEAIDVLNGTGSSQPKMTVCYLKTSSSSANTPEILLSNANSEATSSKTIGLLLATIANGATGKLITSGEFDKFDTSAYNVGDRLWLSTTDGQMTTTVPSAPNHAVFIGIVTRKQSQNGRILVAIQNGYELQELHNVSITTPTDGQALMYEAVTQLWKNKTISTGITIGTTAIASGTIGRVLFEGAGNVVQESANLFWDNTNGRLGIGTSSPAHPLQVYRNTSAGYLASFNSGATLNTNASLTVRIENANLPSLQALNAGAGAFSTFALNPLGGNILIGTTTDAGFKLDVNGTVIVRDTLSISNQGRISWGGGFLNIFADSSNGLSLHTPFGRVLSCTQTTGNVLIGTTTDVASSLLTMQSTTKGFLPPRMTTTQKNAIASPAEGLQVWDTTLKLMFVYNGTTWISL